MTTTSTGSNQLTFGQIEQLWVANGGDPAWAPTMAGIALAESGGNWTSWNQNAATGDNSIGLWQINYFGTLAPSRTAAFGPPDQLLNDPNAQARAAISILGGGGGISAWKGDFVGNAAQNGSPLSLATVQNLVSQGGFGSTSDATPPAAMDVVSARDFLKLIPNIGPFLGNAPLPGVPGGTSLGSLANIEKVFADLGSAQWWRRVGVGVLGIGMMVVGTAIYFASTDTGKKTISTGVEVAAMVPK